MEINETPVEFNATLKGLLDEIGKAYKRGFRDGVELAEGEKYTDEEWDDSILKGVIDEAVEETYEKYKQGLPNSSGSVPPKST